MAVVCASVISGGVVSNTTSPSKAFRLQTSRSAMTRAQDLANQADAIIHELQKELANPTPDIPVIDTVDALNKACATGGTYKVAPASGYKGNFVASKPVTLIGTTPCLLYTSPSPRDS